MQVVAQFGGPEVLVPVPACAIIGKTLLVA